MNEPEIRIEGILMARLGKITLESYWYFDAKNDFQIIVNYFNNRGIKFKPIFKAHYFLIELDEIILDILVMENF